VARYLADVLIARRDRIGRTWLTRMNPVVDPRIEDQQLRFGNAAVDAGIATPPRTYLIRWNAYDNVTTQTAPLSPWLPAIDTHSDIPGSLPESTEFLMSEIVAIHPQYAAWTKPTRAYFRRVDAQAWELVGLERQ
jgi:hypothetical protein